MHRVVFLYARSDSQRLPGKALMPLAGRALVDIVAARAARVGAESCALLTTARAVDDALARHGAGLGLDVVRGHATDLVARSLQAIAQTGATHFLRVNGDSPFFAPELAQAAMAHLAQADLVSNLFDRRFPYGVAVEWIAAQAYARLAPSALPPEREHVTQHLYRQADRLRAVSMDQPRDDTALRLALDTPEDHARLSALIGARDPAALPYWDMFGLSAPCPALRPHPANAGAA